MTLLFLKHLTKVMDKELINKLFILHKSSLQGAKAPRDLIYPPEIKDYRVQAQ